MRKTLKHLLVGSLLIFGTTACADLEIMNENDPDAERSLATPGDVLSLIGGSYNAWWNGTHSYDGASLLLSNAAFQHAAPWANAGMEKYGRLPRVGFINSISDGDYNYATYPWFRSYRAIAAAADGLKALEKDEVASQLTADQLGSAKAFGKFVQGMAHATIAVLFSEGFAVDETTDLIEAQDPLPYDELMTKALGYFDESISLSQGASWTLPAQWMSVAVTGPQLARLAHSWKAIFASQNARSLAERKALNWASIIADVDAGITSDFMAVWDWDNGWYNEALDYGAYYGWSQMPYFIYGMADQSGNYQLWDSKSLTEKSYKIPVSASDTTQILIVTPDLRFPQGSTVEAQRAAEGTYFHINADYEAGSTWARPDRGTWRWSWYKHTRYTEYGNEGVFDQPEVLVSTLTLIKAEGLYHTGQAAAAATIVNETRTANGLNATDASSTNTSCVPKLPDGSCGDLWEMLKWEKRMETTFTGPLGATWFFDSRGWDDLWAKTWIHMPMPCAEAEVLQLLPCKSYGGPAGEDGAPLSNYGWNGEG